LNLIVAIAFREEFTDILDFTDGERERMSGIDLLLLWKGR
jgi:hypothetical protein